MPVNGWVNRDWLLALLKNGTRIRHVFATVTNSHGNLLFLLLF